MDQPSKLSAPQRLHAYPDSACVTQVVLYEPSNTDIGSFEFRLFPFAQPFINISRDQPFTFRNPETTTKAYFCAQLTKPISLSMPAGDRTAVILFHPLSSNLLNETTEARPSAFPVRLIKDSIAQKLTTLITMGTAEQALARLVTFVESMFDQSWVPEPRVDCMWNKVIESGGNIRLSALADMSEITERRVQQLFHTHLGASPKAMCKVVRFQVYLQSLAATCYQSGLRDCFFDDAHFIKDLKQHTGMTPLEFERYLVQNEARGDVLGASPF